MIPSKISEFLKGPVMIWAGTRDEQLTPHLHRVSAIRLSDDNRQVTCLIPKEFRDNLPAAGESGPQIAVTIGHPLSHETYQFKGSIVDVRESDEDDRALCTAFEVTLTPVWNQLGLPLETMKMYIPPPEVAVTLEVEQFFDQAPGPGAGSKLEGESA